MATYYFRNASATWLTATNWSLSSGGPADGSTPTQNDDVIFDSNSRSSVTLNSNRECRNISFTNWTGSFDMSFVFLRIYGNLDCGDALFSITNAGSWQMGATTGVMNGQTIRTNGKVLSGTLSFGYISGTNPIRLIDDVTCYQLQNQSNIGTASLPIFSGQTMYVQGNIITSSTGRNLYTTTPIKMIGTGNITTFNSNAAICCNLEIITAGNINFNGVVYCGTNCVITHTSGTTTGNVIYLQANTTLNTSAMTWNYIYTTSNVISGQPIFTNTLDILANTSANFTNDFTTSNLIMGAGTLGLTTGKTYSVTGSMVSTVSTLAAKASIISLTSGVKAIFNLGQGATQDNGYLSATDIDSSGGRSIWTYKGTLTRTINWNQLSTNPKKHVLKANNRILKHT